MTREWDGSMATGLESVDDQHRRLIALLNQLQVAMGEGRSRTEIGQILGGLRAYAGLHFSHEEECMTRYGCPVAEQNAREHREFVAVVRDFVDEYEREGASPKLVLRVESQLAWWLENHILATDVQLRPCVARAAG